MELGAHIKHLLYNNDCVVVPHWGAFVCAHQKLEFNIHTGLIHPPRKTVSFNQNLNNNDDLLANHIANKEKLGHSQALENINAWVSNLNKKLQNGETVNIDGLGSFSLNSDKKVLFVPFANTNFSTASYGLETVILDKKLAAAAPKEKVVTPPPMAPKPQEKTIIAAKVDNEEEVDEIIVPAPPIPPTRKPRKTFKRLRRVFGILFTLLLFLALFISQDYFYHYKMEQAGHKNYSKPKNTSLKQDISETPVFEHEAILSDEDNNSDYTDENTSNNSEEDDNSLENNTVTQSSVETSIAETAETDSVFYIIAGAFKSESNAKDLQNSLEQDGFASEIINTSGSSLYRVGYQRYPSRNKAEGNLNSVRNRTHNFAAWVLAVKP